MGIECGPPARTVGRISAYAARYNVMSARLDLAVVEMGAPSTPRLRLAQVIILASLEGPVMRHTYFEIRNFKGIKHVRLDLDASPRSTVYTLIGLNESGKTTVLEAMDSSAYYMEKTLAPLRLPGHADMDPHDLIPIGSRSNFNDTIEIAAGYVLDAEDNRKLGQHLRKEIGFEVDDPVTSLEIVRPFVFENSVHQTGQDSPTWNIAIRGKTKRGRTTRDLAEPDLQTAIKFLKTLLPPVLYFPNFLFEFPNKIYLRDDGSGSEETRRHAFYRTVLQDVLDAIGQRMDLQTHVLARAESGDKYQLKSLESVLLKMGDHISTTVFGTRFSNVGVATKKSKLSANMMIGATTSSFASRMAQPDTRSVNAHWDSDGSSHSCF
jgi:hypothetical protein